MFVVFVCCCFSASFCCYPVFLCGCVFVLFFVLVSFPLAQCLFVVVVGCVCFDLFLPLPSVCLWLLCVFLVCFGPLALTQCLWLYVAVFLPLFALTQHRGDCKTVFPE